MTHLSVIKRRALWVIALLVAGCLPRAAIAFAADPYVSSAPPIPETPVDKAVVQRWRQLGITPAGTCSDAVFIRRVYLDVIGTLPSALEARDFILDRSPDKRRRLINRVLDRDEFVDFWAMKWGDLLRVKAEFPINLWPNAARAYHHWIHSCLQDNMPYNRFVREMLTASGSNFRVGSVNFYRAMQNREPAGIAQAVALTFMGARASQWPSHQLSGMAAFFAQVGFKSTDEWKEEIVFFDPAKDTNGLAKTAVFPDGTPARLSSDRDPRGVFADWLIDPKNPWFTRNIANRVWSWLLGRGIIHEPDDIRPDNPPSNPELLALLEKELVAANYDLKSLYRLILNSRTYQLSSLPRTQSPEADANFASYPLRRLDAEVLVDALNQVTGSTEKYSSSIPEPFSFIPENQRSIALPDGSITSSVLDLFGRPPRDTGLESERNNRSTPAQRLHLLNSSHIQRKIEQSRMVQYLTQGNKNPPEIVVAMYLAILSRFPTEQELQTALAYARSGDIKKREAAVDLAWALINTAEFLYRH